MAKSYSFSVLRLAAHPMRNERLNVGLAIFCDNQVDVRTPKNLDKIRALSFAIDAKEVRATVEHLSVLDSIFLSAGPSNVTARLNRLKTLSSLEMSELGSFLAPSASDYERVVERLLATLVDPEPAPPRHTARRSRLLSEMKNALRNRRVLARKGEGLSAHRIVVGLELAEGLSADFVLKNGAMHVIETVDAASDTFGIRKVVADIAVSALVLEQARMTFGADKTLSKLVYNAAPSVEAAANASLMAAEHQGVQLINWASEADRLKLLENLSMLAVPWEVNDNSKRQIGFNTSVQNKLNLH